VAPPLPQLASAGALQVAPEQQPEGQLLLLQPLQRPEVQVWPVGQVSQALPPPPHAAGASPGRQVPSAAQQPPAHDVPSQTQALPMQRCPAAHAAPVPHRQSPTDEQLSAPALQATQVAPALPQLASERVTQVAPWQQPLGQERLSQVHSPPTQRWPPTQAGPAPQAQAPPAVQVSALAASHALQAPPAAPQLVSDG
jgi:hypothetical protein